MHRVGDDAGEARGVEDAFVEIELPGAVLLRHQAALQAIGELADHALEMRELLVEMVAQAAEFLGVAQRVGLDDLVELVGIGVILLAGGLVAERARRQPRTLGAARLLLVARAHLHLGLGLVGDGLGSIVLLGRVLGFLALGAVALGLAGIALVVAGLVRLTVGVLLVLRVLVVVVLQFGRLVAELEVADELAGGAGERFLVGERIAQLLEITAGGAFDVGAPHVDHRLGRFRRLGAEELFAGDQADHVGDRRIFLGLDAGMAALVGALAPQGREIVGDADHLAGAQRLDADLLDRLEDRARRLAAGHAAQMGLAVVMAQLQRHRIGLAADAADILDRQIARRHGDAGFLAQQ